MDRNDNITPHFKWSEFVSEEGVRYLEPDGRTASMNSIVIMNNIRQLAWALEMLRAFSENPIIINSGFRTHEENEACGGAKESYHMKGMAVDIDKEFLHTTLLNDRWPGGYHEYDTFVHLDIGPQRRW